MRFVGILRQLTSLLRRLGQYVVLMLEAIGWAILWPFKILRWILIKLRQTFASTRGRLRWALVSIIVLTLFSGTLAYPQPYATLAGAVNLALDSLQQRDLIPALDFRNVKQGFTIRLPYAPARPYRLGLDLVGGTQLIYDADTSKIQDSDRADALEGVRDVIERRVNAFGVAEPLVQTDRSGEQWRVLVELAGVKDVNQAIKQIGETPLLEFKEQGEAPAQRPLTDDERKQIAASDQSAKTKAIDLIRRIKGGEGFANLAKEFSDDPGSKDKGGEYDFIKRGTFVAEYDKAIFDDLKVGEVAPEPVKTTYGYHIIEKLEERGQGEDKEVKSRHILLKVMSESDFVPPPDPNNQWKNTELSGKQLSSAVVVFDPQTNRPQVSLEFDSDGAKLFEEITSRNVGKMVAIFLDQEPISVPRVNEAISGGRAVITGDFTIVEAKLLAQRLNAGALPVPITLVSQQTVGATLGEIAVARSLRAGLFGFLLVALFMIAYYRLPGVIAVVALAMYSSFVLAIFKLWPVTLTLAGIAGFILSLGMAVDANILIFERLKEELRRGKALPQAMSEGFLRAWTSIRDSNASSLITCIILSWFGTSVVKGFALTLAIGIIISMFSAITVTRTLLRLVVRERLGGRWIWLFGVRRAQTTSPGQS